jgi:peptidoglycan L-alanyl-D-glutamate endopeptidase CwlK
MSNIKSIQLKLKNAGFYSGIVDGIWGDMSDTALDAAILSGKLNSIDNPPVLLVPNKGNTVEVVPDKPVRPSGFKLGNKSLSNLKGVNDDLVRVVKRAIELTEIDFTVNEGLRTLAKQKEYVKRGVSQTLKSNHLTGNAVDLIPIVNGKLEREDWDAYYPLAEAMQKAAEDLNINVRWGGCWSSINNKPGKPKQWVKDYVNARKKMGRSAFIDGPHFEVH